MGGGTANSLAEIPSKINSMSNLKKMVILKVSDEFNTNSTGTSIYRKKIDCNFEIKRFFIFSKNKNNNYGITSAMDSEDYKTFNRFAELDTYAGPYSKLYIENKNEIVWETRNEGSFYYRKIDKIIVLS